jgi:hypothetical protein
MNPVPVPFCHLGGWQIQGGKGGTPPACHPLSPPTLKEWGEGGGEVAPPWQNKVAENAATDRPPDRMLEGQPYWLVGRRPYTRADGSETTLDVWESLCADCKAPFQFLRAGGQPIERFSPNRRCDRHRRPGSRVGNRSRNHARNVARHGT